MDDKTVRQKGQEAIAAAFVASAGALFFFYKSVIWFGERIEGPAAAILLAGLVFAGIGVFYAVRARRLLRQARDEDITGATNKPGSSEHDD